MVDAEIWTNITKGDAKALQILHEKYFHGMCLYASKIINETGITEEIVSDCFIKIWEKRQQLHIQKSVKHYLFLMLRNAIIDHLRKPYFDSELRFDIPDLPDESVFDDQQTFGQLYQCIDKLPPQRRQILEMIAFENMSYKETAQKLSISVNTVKTQMGRAYKFLKETLDPTDFHLLLIHFSKLEKK